MSLCILQSILTPIGSFLLVEYQDTLVALCAAEDLPSLLQKLPDCNGYLYENSPLLLSAQTQLSEYFHGSRHYFDLPLSPQGSPFQKSVWQQLQMIPYGCSCSYGDIARKLKQKGARAVGTAVGKNPLPIFIPCHRVLPSSGELGNFSMQGGSQSKAYLLDLEGVPYKK